MKRLMILSTVAAGLAAIGPRAAAESPGRAVAVHDTRVDPFLLPQDGGQCGDPFPVHWDGTWHLYALEKGLRKVLHFTSTDLVTWTEHEPAMVGRGIATGTVLRHEGTYYLFYTDAGPQTIRLVTSDNPWQFDFRSSKLVAKADNRVYTLKKRKFRDCYVFYHEDEKRWWMLVEATSDGAVAVGLFTSEDLHHWTRHAPIFKDPARQHGSCPQLIEHAGHWYLTLLDYPTWYYRAPAPRGPWKLGGFYHTKRMTAASRWATDGQRQLGWGFFTQHGTPEKKRSGYGGPLGVGRELVFGDDGTLGVRPLPELVAALKEPQHHADLYACADVRKGRWEVDRAKQELRCLDEENGLLLFDLPQENPHFYFEADVRLAEPAARAEVIVRTSEAVDRGYRVALEPEKKTVSIRQFDPRGGLFDQQQHAFAEGRPSRLQVFVCDGQVEAFVDGHTALSARVVEKTAHRIAVEVTGGQAAIHNPLLHHFRSP